MPDPQEFAPLEADGEFAPLTPGPQEAASDYVTTTGAAEIVASSESVLGSVESTRLDIPAKGVRGFHVDANGTVIVGGTDPGGGGVGDGTRPFLFFDAGTDSVDLVYDHPLLDNQGGVQITGDANSSSVAIQTPTDNGGSWATAPVAIELEADNSGTANFNFLNLSQIDAEDAHVQLHERTAPATPDANRLRIYVKDKSSVSALYAKDDAGTEHELTNAAAAADLTAHTADTSDAHDASAISILDTAGDFTATDVEGALAELQSDHETDSAALTTHEGDTSTHGATVVAGTEDITFETLDANGDVGTTASTLAEGDHTHAGGGGPTYIMKTADETVTNSTTLQNDDHFAFSVDANSTYYFELNLYADANAVGVDLKVAWTLPASATVDWGVMTDDRANLPSAEAQSATVGSDALGTGTIEPIDVLTTQTIVTLKGWLTIAGTSGTAQLQWAQSSNPGGTTENITLRKGSRLEYQKAA